MSHESKLESEKLYTLAHQAASSLANTAFHPTDPKLREWNEGLKHADVDVLIELASLLTTNKQKPDANLKTLREAVISEIERKNTGTIVGTLERIDKAASELTAASVNLANVSVDLTRWALIIAIIGAVLAAAQVGLAVVQIYSAK